MKGVQNFTCFWEARRTSPASEICAGLYLLLKGSPDFTFLWKVNRNLPLFSERCTGIYLLLKGVQEFTCFWRLHMTTYKKHHSDIFIYCIIDFSINELWRENCLRSQQTPTPCKIKANNCKLIDLVIRIKLTRTILMSRFSKFWEIRSFIFSCVYIG